MIMFLYCTPCKMTLANLHLLYMHACMLLGGFRAYTAHHANMALANLHLLYMHACMLGGSCAYTPHQINVTLANLGFPHPCLHSRAYNAHRINMALNNLTLFKPMPPVRADEVCTSAEFTQV